MRHPDPKLADSAKRPDGVKSAYDQEFLELRKEGQTRAAITMGQLWDPGTEIRVAFLDSDPFYHQKVQQHLKEWTDAVNLSFAFVPPTDPTAMVRISFAFNRLYDSQLGFEAHERLRGRGGYTMRLGFDPQHDEDMYNYYTLHEFGHVLGLVHEHQNPGTTIQWNEQAVINYYMRTNPGWTADTVRQNILNALVYQQDVQNSSTAFDKDSVMLYPIPFDPVQGVALASNITQPGFNNQPLGERPPVHRNALPLQRARRRGWSQEGGRDQGRQQARLLPVRRRRGGQLHGGGGRTVPSERHAVRTGHPQQVHRHHEERGHQAYRGA